MGHQTLFTRSPVQVQGAGDLYTGELVNTVWCPTAHVITGHFGDKSPPMSVSVYSLQSVYLMVAVASVALRLLQVKSVME